MENASLLLSLEANEILTMDTSKQELKRLGIDHAIAAIMRATEYLDDKRYHNDSHLLWQQFNDNVRQRRNNLISNEEYSRIETRIHQAVLELIDELPENTWTPISDVTSADALGSTDKPRVLRIWFPIVIAVLVTIFLFVKFFLRDDSMQLTVYVQDASGKPIAELQNKGKVIVDFGNDRRPPLIGETGRTNLGEIPEKFRGETIPIVLEAEGYEPVEPDKKYVLDGKPVYFLVRRDNSLGTIQGIVQTRDGSEFIAGALVMVDHDTTTLTDGLGRFKLVLPEKMHKAEYLLTVKKAGFRESNEMYRPKTTSADIRLEK